MRILFLENNDSFSWNVIDALPAPRESIIVRPGAEGVREVETAFVDALVIGPGPMDPVRTGLVEVVLAAARRGLPTLGICLGCQAIGLAFGARLTRATPIHGKRWPVVFSRSRFFHRFVGTRSVMRYHSLALADVVSPLQVVAQTPEGIPMAVEHTRFPIAGLQFHPDSYATDEGPEMIEEFFRLGVPA